MDDNPSNIYSLNEKSFCKTNQLNTGFVLKLLCMLLEPPISLLILYLWPPKDPSGEVSAFLGWPIFHFIIGLVLSWLDQPKVVVDNNGRIVSVSDKGKLRVYHYRIVMVLFLSAFEFVGAICVLSIEQFESPLLWIIPISFYGTYVLSAFIWLDEVKQWKTHNEKHLNKTTSENNAAA